MSWSTLFPTFARLVQRNGNRHGFALMLVLGALVLMTAVAVSFLTSTAAELKTAKAYSQGLQAQRLATLPVNLVMASITSATSQGTASDPVAWASQPGLIRSWNTNGELVRVTRLYSSSNIFSTSYDSAAEAASINGWKGTLTNRNYNALWADLNSPVVTSGGTRVYPIVTPSQNLDSNAGVPVDNPATPAQEGVMGFSVNPSGALGWSGGTPSANNNPVPMPVRWLYVLQDGTLTAPTGSQTNASLSGASASNPPVARIAYWTDDETCKVNLNTASEGVFWDVPRGHSATDFGSGSTSNNTSPISIETQPRKVYSFGRSIPFQNEFQRTPGHPALVCLSAIFGSNGMLPRPTTINKDTYSQITEYFKLAPRTTEGGSKGGTALMNVTSQALTIKTDRLYATPNEVYFQSDRNPNSPKISAQDLARRQFLLTTASSAPETTLFETPRVSLWPIFEQSNMRNAKDKLFVLNTTLSGKPYFFQRHRPFPGQFDLTGVTNPSALGSSHDPSKDVSDTTAAGKRNMQLYDYLVNLTTRKVPGFGASFTDGNKYPEPVLKQTLAMIFDYIRSFVNSAKVALPTDASPTGYSFSPAPTNYPNRGIRQIYPVTLPNGSRGISRMLTVQELALVFYTRSIVDDPAEKNTQPPVSPHPTDEGKRVPYTNEIGLALIINPYMVAPGSPSVNPYIRFRVRGLDSLKANSQPFFRRENAVVGIRAGNGRDGRSPFTGLRQMAQPDNDGSNTGRDNSKPSEFENYNLIGDLGISISSPAYRDKDPNPGPGTFTFDGGKLEIDVVDGFGDVSSDAVLQTIEIDLPRGTFPIPTLRRAYEHTSPPYKDTHYKNGGTNDTLFDYYTYMSIDPTKFSERIGSPGPNFRGWIKRGDVVRSMILSTSDVSRGDVRLMAALRKVPSEFFKPHPDWDNPSVLHAHTLDFGRTGSDPLYNRVIKDLTVKPPLTGPDNWNPPPWGGVDSALRSPPVAGVSYPTDKNDLPSYIQVGLNNGARIGNTELPGDWDSGPGNIGDGAAINKTDEVATNISRDTYRFDYDRMYYPEDAQSFEEEVGGVSYTPSRQIASAVQFGSLPAYVDPQNPTQSQAWRTLVFNPYPAAGNDHPGHGSGTGGPGPAARAPFSRLPDHLFLDLFQMPVIEPYAISERLATSGKINLNHQIVPFTYIDRSTALCALLKPMMMTAIPKQSLAPSVSNRAYKWVGVNAANNLYGRGTAQWDYRYSLNVPETIRAINERFGFNDLYRSASEICSVFLVPQRPSGFVYPDFASPPPATYSRSDMENWWKNMEGTADNLRESIYNQIYPLLTTRSNTYTVHWRVQLLDKPRNPTQWNETTDKVLSEYRGSTLIERYIDPDDPNIPDYATNSSAPPLHNFYKWRVVSNTQFNP